MKEFKVGDVVEWTSQSHGYDTKKKGRVMAVVPAGDMPHNVLSFIVSSGGRYYTRDPKYSVAMMKLVAATQPRTVQSYVVEVNFDSRKKSQLYYPMAQKLRKV